MDYDYKTLEEKYKSLPGDIQLAMSSTDVSKTIMEIAQKHDLFIDQADELSDEVSYVMLGLKKSKDFIKNISKSLGIDEKKSIETTQDINKEIFETIMTDAEKSQQKSVISAVEEAGGFVIDKAMVHDEMKENLESKKNIINVIEKENFEPKESSVPLDHLLGDTPESPLPQTSIKQTPTQQATQNQESIVDTLLAHGVAMTMDGDASKTTNKPEKKVKPYDGTDPYREPTE